MKIGMAFEPGRRPMSSKSISRCRDLEMISGWAQRSLARWCIASACLLFVPVLGCGPRTYRRDRTDTDKAAPEFTATSLDGAAVQLSSLRGKVVIMHIWAAWNCADELPGLDEVAARLQTAEIAVIAVSIDTDRSDLQTVVESRANWSLSFLHDPTARVARLYDPSRFPAAYIIDRTGTIRHAFPGVRASDLQEVEARAREVMSNSFVAPLPLRER